MAPPAEGAQPNRASAGPRHSQGQAPPEGVPKKADGEKRMVGRRKVKRRKGGESSAKDVNLTPLEQLLSKDPTLMENVGQNDMVQITLILQEFYYHNLDYKRSGKHLPWGHFLRRLENEMMPSFNEARRRCRYNELRLRDDSPVNGEGRVERGDGELARMEFDSLDFGVDEFTDFEDILDAELGNVSGDELFMDPDEDDEGVGQAPGDVVGAAKGSAKEAVMHLHKLENASVGDTFVCWGAVGEALTGTPKGALVKRLQVLNVNALDNDKDGGEATAAGKKFKEMLMSRLLGNLMNTASDRRKQAISSIEVEISDDKPPPPKHMQGNPEMYEDDAIQRREWIKESEVTELAIRKWWKELGFQSAGKVVKEQYTTMVNLISEAEV
eukprot:gene9128-10817_t